MPRVRDRFAVRLRHLREKAQLTQVELSRASGITQGTLSQYEAGLRSPRWCSVLRLCQALKVDPREFL